jgi:hypothetical protein
MSPSLLTHLLLILEELREKGETKMYLENK